jgi:hypothetical protein
VINATCVCACVFVLQGEYCLQIKMDILAGSGIAAVGATQVRVPAQPQSITRQVRHVGRCMGVTQVPFGADRCGAVAWKFACSASR